MSTTRSILTVSVAALVGFAGWAHAQAAATSPGHLIVVTLLEHPGQMPQFSFEPATFTAHRGDTLRFVQGAATMHNVHFKKVPKGARLGGAAVSDYLTVKGQSYTLPVDARFVDGTYEIVCDPHEMIGMHAMLTVVTTSAVALEK